MKTNAGRRDALSRWAGCLTLGVALVVSSCSLDRVQVPGLEGPAELGLSVNLRAVPDVLTADGYSTSWIEAIVRDQNGQRLQGRAILFALADEDGNFADLGTLNDPGGNRLHAGTATALTDGDGVARVIYTAPPRTDATANQSVMVLARPVTDDFNGALTRQVRIELKSAEPRLFPQNPLNELPNCNWAVEAPQGFEPGVMIHFQSTSNDPDGTIIRYAWDFGDGERADHPDPGHVYRLTGTYTVTHVVTDDDGGQAACAADLTIANP